MHPIESHPPRSGVVVPLPARLDLPAAEPLCRELRDALASGAAVTVDGGDVARVSTPCVQVLVAAAAEAGARRIPFAVHPRSGALADALADLGIAADCRAVPDLVA